MKKATEYRFVVKERFLTPNGMIESRPVEFKCFLTHLTRVLKLVDISQKQFEELCLEFDSADKAYRSGKVASPDTYKTFRGRDVFYKIELHLE